MLFFENEYITNLIHAQIVDGVVNFSWTDSWLNEGTGTLRIGENALYLQMQTTNYSEFNRSDMATNKERTFLFDRAISDEERARYYENLED